MPEEFIKEMPSPYPMSDLSLEVNEDQRSAETQTEIKDACCTQLRLCILGMLNS